MSKKQDKDTAKKARATRSVPAEDAPLPGLSQRARELVALGVCGFALYAMLCLATFRMADLDGAIPTGDMRNLGGAVGYYLSFGFTRALGIAGWVPFLILLAYGVLMFMGRSCERLTIKLLGVVCFSAILSILFAGQDGLAGVRDATPYGAGGVFGSVVSPKLYAAFGGTGRMLILMFGAVVALLIATEWMFSELLLRAYSAVEPPIRRLFTRTVAAGVGEVEALEGAPSPPRRRRRAAAKVVEEEEESAALAEVDADEEGSGDAASEGVASQDAEPGDAASEDDAQAAADLDRGADADCDEDEAAVIEEAPEPEADALDAADEASAPTPGAADDVEPVEEPVQERKPARILVKKPRRRRRKAAAQSNLPFQDYPFPPVDLFQEPDGESDSTSTAALDKGGEAIVNKLANFKIEAEVVAASVGPTITQYELKLADCIRVSKIVGFELDLAAALEAQSVRIVAPIPSRSTVGVEVPNQQRKTVFMRELLELAGRSEDQAIPLYLGKDSTGEPIIEDLAGMPHLLIAGTTGSGKSVCINTILLSILMTRTPEQVKLILVDPKMVELQGYKKVPHLCCEVVTNMKKAPSVLQWAVDEMERRYALLSAVGTKEIKGYNRLGEAELAKRLGRDPEPDRVRLSYVVIVIDEFADLMVTAAKDVEELIQRLAQKSRAVGMHVILATQRPSSEVITGVIKANLPCQIAFKVNRKIDSRVILDSNGAEKLLGHGDMLYVPPGGAGQMRAQGTFVTEEEQHAVVSFLEDEGQAPAFNPELVQRQSSSRPSASERDELYYQAVEVIVGQQRGSATLLQRALQVGYTRATRLLEMMEEDSIVGPFVGSKAREVLLTLEEWRARREAEEQAAAEADEYEDDGYEEEGYEEEGYEEDGYEEDGAEEDGAEAEGSGERAGEDRVGGDDLDAPCSELQGEHAAEAAVADVDEEEGDAEVDDAEVDDAADDDDYEDAPEDDDEVAEPEEEDEVGELEGDEEAGEEPEVEELGDDEPEDDEPEDDEPEDDEPEDGEPEDGESAEGDPDEDDLVDDDLVDDDLVDDDPASDARRG